MLAFGHHEDRTPTYGYAATREAAMAAFARSWRRGNGHSVGAERRVTKREPRCACAWEGATGGYVTAWGLARLLVTVAYEPTMNATKMPTK
jgi:hypothetical protein